MRRASIIYEFEYSNLSNYISRSLARNIDEKLNRKEYTPKFVKYIHVSLPKNKIVICITNSMGEDPQFNRKKKEYCLYLYK